jgi:hypothetical protein
LAEFDTLDGGQYWRCSINILNLKIKKGDYVTLFYFISYL